MIPLEIPILVGFASSLLSPCSKVCKTAFLLTLSWLEFFFFLRSCLQNNVFPETVAHRIVSELFSYFHKVAEDLYGYLLIFSQDL